MTTAEASAGSTEHVTEHVAEHVAEYVAEGSLARGLGYAFVSSLLVWSMLIAVAVTLVPRA